MRKISKILMAGILTMMMILSINVQAESGHPSRVVDDADLLETYEEEELLKELDEISERLDFDIVVVTTNSTEGKSAEAYADDYFDYNGYGMGDSYDGALLLVNMGNREWHISTTGYGITALSDNDLDYIGEEVADYLSYGDYASAFETFAELVEEEVLDAKDGETLEIGEVLVKIPIALLIGGLIAFIPVTVMKKKMDNVEMRSEASDYVMRNRVAITEQRDMFLYRTVNRRRKPKDSGGGSSTHRSSSGRSHGGRGGRF
ncbi:MAG: TPM domain-containing protein [Tyzzerella sp.]|nr:TPM domain-containing protein [Tyzzerella sp.]